MALYLKIEGSGPPLLLIHGFGFNQKIWHESVVSQMQKTHTCYLIDLPGFGESDFNPYTIHELLKVILALLPETFAVCGWSLGGLIGLAMALHYPSRVSRFISVTSDPGFQEGVNGIDYQEMKTFYESLFIDKEKAIKTFLFLQFSMTGFDKKVYHRLLKTLTPYPDLSALSWAMDLLIDTKLYQALPEVEVPSCFIFGEDDKIISAQIKDKIEAIDNPQIKTKTIKGAGHIPFLTHQDEFIQTLRVHL